jgi:elongation factor Ts
MADITAAMVKELRQMTDAAMMECKKALVEADGDMDKAVDILRTRGLAAVAKKAGRATNEGVVWPVVAQDGKSAIIFEMNCETDFVSSNQKYKDYAKKIGATALAAKPADMDAFKAAKNEDGETVEEILTDAIHILGENIQIARFEYIEADAIASYIHMGGKIGVLVTFDTDVDATSDVFAEYGHGVAMQVAADNPVAVDKDGVPADLIAHEREIYMAQAAESGKPANIQEKMVDGRIAKYLAEVCLLNKEYIKDPDKTIGSLTEETAKALGGSIKVSGFRRLMVGGE